MRRTEPRSHVVLSDDEVAARVRDENAGQPEERIKERVEAELAERAANQRLVQHSYDTSHPTTPYKRVQN